MTIVVIIAVNMECGKLKNMMVAINKSRLLVSHDVMNEFSNDEKKKNKCEQFSYICNTNILGLIK